MNNEVNNLTDNEIRLLLKPFIGNIIARRPDVLDVLDLRFLYNTTKKAILQQPELQLLDINMLINNTLIVNATNSSLLDLNKATDAIMLNVLSNKSFLGNKIK